MSNLLTDEEVKECFDLLNRYDDLTPDELARFNELTARNEASLPELSGLVSCLADLTDEDIDKE
jgi:hypothetical protein